MTEITPLTPTPGRTIPSAASIMERADHTLVAIERTLDRLITRLRTVDRLYALLSLKLIEQHGEVPDIEALQRQLRQRRQALGLSQRALSSHAHVGRSTIHMTETRERSDPEIIAHLSAVLSTLEEEIRQLAEGAGS